ncbi:lipopolysaccharide biosynthesis protein [Ruegeria sp.]|uniref:lipopolysaccharide biosynthesis protein n=1 Tax=Ruegeria sp. TaxID=1879320 RepID=UPI003B596EFB
MSIRADLFKATFLALLIKLTSAQLNYLMLVVLAQAMDIEGYGTFAFGFSAALILGQIALMGQNQLVLRVLPAITGPESAVQRSAAIAFGARNVVVAGIVAGLVLVVFGLTKAGNTSIVAAAFLVLPIAFAELQSSVLRTQNRIVSALAPRDILWRLTVIAVAGLVLLNILPKLSPVWAFLLCAGSLIFWLVVQASLAPVTRYQKGFKESSVAQRRGWWAMSQSFWLASVVVVSGPNLAVVVIGLIMNPEQTAPFFAALKTAQLMTLLLLAANLAATPVISKAYAEGAHEKLRSICRLVSGAAGGFAALGLVVFWAFGDVVLGMFGAGYAVAKPELLVMSLGFAFSAASGLNGILMQMAGQEKAFARLSLGWNFVGLAALIPMVSAYGTFGGACAVALTTIAWNIQAWILCRCRIGTDPSLLGFLLPDPHLRMKV